MLLHTLPQSVVISSAQMNQLRGLGISADELLSIGCSVGVENLGGELAHKISGMRDRRIRALSRVPKRLILLGREEPPSAATADHDYDTI